MFRRHTVSLTHAFSGFIYALSTQPNFLIHLALSTLAVTAGLYFHLDRYEWLVITFTITLGLVIELVNTAVEAATDLISKEWHLDAKIAKDTSAAAMLVYAIGSLVIAAMIFLPRLIG